MSSLNIVIIGVLMGIINLAGSSIPDAYAPSATKGYSFSYDVKDPYTGQDFGHQEKLEDIVTGEYHVLLPDDRYQVVNYRADHNGYVADVKYGEGASSTYINKGGSSKYNNKDHQQAAYGNNDAKYQQSYGKQEDSKYNNEKIYGKQDDKYSQQTYGKQEDNKYAEPLMTYGKQEDKYAEKNYGGNHNYQDPSSTYGKPQTYPSSGSGAGYSAGGMDGADGYPSSGSGSGYSSGHLDGYGSQNTAGHHDMKQNYGGSYLADFAAGIHNKQQQGSGGYGSYTGPNGCKCV